MRLAGYEALHKLACSEVLYVAHSEGLQSSARYKARSLWGSAPYKSLRPGHRVCAPERDYVQEPAPRSKDQDKKTLGGKVPKGGVAVIFSETGYQFSQEFSPFIDNFIVNAVPLPLSGLELMHWVSGCQPVNSNYRVNSCWSGPTFRAYVLKQLLLTICLRFCFVCVKYYGHWVSFLWQFFMKSPQQGLGDWWR